MSDLHDLCPAKKSIDITKQTTGNHEYEVSLWCPTYSGIKQEEVFPKRLTVRLKAMSFKEACEKTEIIAASLREVRDIWQVEITGVYSP